MVFHIKYCEIYQVKMQRLFHRVFAWLFSQGISNFYEIICEKPCEIPVKLYK